MQQAGNTFHVIKNHEKTFFRSKYLPRRVLACTESYQNMKVHLHWLRTGPYPTSNITNLNKQNSTRFSKVMEVIIHSGTKKLARINYVTVQRYEQTAKHPPQHWRRSQVLIQVLNYVGIILARTLAIISSALAKASSGSIRGTATAP